MYVLFKQMKNINMVSLGKIIKDSHVFVFAVSLSLERQAAVLTFPCQRGSDTFFPTYLLILYLFFSVGFLYCCQNRFTLRKGLFFSTRQHGRLSESSTTIDVRSSQTDNALGVYAIFYWHFRFGYAFVHWENKYGINKNIKNIIKAVKLLLAYLVLTYFLLSFWYCDTALLLLFFC